MKNASKTGLLPVLLFIILDAIVCQNIEAAVPAPATLRERASILQNKISLCERDISQGAPDCYVIVNWEGNRKVSISEARRLAAQYLRDAQKMDAASEIVNWSGNWDRKQKQLVHSVLNRLADKKIRDWIAVNARFELLDDPGQQDMISPWAGNATLIFNNYFFSINRTNATRENLIAFEAGKAFWLNKLAGNQTLKTWFSNYSTENLSLIRRLANAKHQGETLSFIYDNPQETSSAFGYVFRAQALGILLDKTAQDRFEVRIAPLLQGK